MNSSGPVRRRIRQRMFNEQWGKCHWCDRRMTLDIRPNPPFPNYATFDHVIAQAEGGSGRRENLRLACWECNQRRGAELSAKLRAERQTALRTHE